MQVGSPIRNNKHLQMRRKLVNLRRKHDET